MMKIACASMTNWLIQKFIKDSDNTKDTAVRTSYGKLAGIVGIVCNVLLFVGKLVAGLISGSIAIMADAVNNLSDAASNVVALLGFRLSAMPADDKHPYGYARYEYLAGLTVSVLVVAIGISLGKESIGKLLSPEMLTFNWLSMTILAISILVKLWMSLFNQKIGKRINSDTLIATAADSRNDVLSTGAVLVSMFVAHWTGSVYVDGIMGCLVACFIIYSGIGLVRETLSPLLGETPDPTLVERIHQKVLSHKAVLGMHDLIIHDYGPGHQFASLHIELPAEMDPMVSHDLIDVIENDFMTNENLHISIHYDPIVTSDERIGKIKAFLHEKIHQYNDQLHFHDLRLVPGETHTNILFDLVIPVKLKNHQKQILSDIEAMVKAFDPKFIPKIKAEHSFSGERTYTSENTKAQLLSSDSR